MNVNALAVRRALGRHDWAAPKDFGPDGWFFENAHENGRIIVTQCEFEGNEWIHASVAFRDRMPVYAELALMHHAIFPGYAYQVFAPPEQHVNIHANALHLWGRADGKPGLPEFGKYFGSI